MLSSIRLMKNSQNLQCDQVKLDYWTNASYMNQLFLVK